MPPKNLPRKKRVTLRAKRMTMSRDTILQEPKASLDDDKCSLAWDLFVELRKETLEAQRIRAQIVGFKIAFITACIGLIGAYWGSSGKSANLLVPTYLPAVPAFAAVFFDFMVSSYSFSIQRIGVYCREYLEPQFRGQNRTPERLWEEYMLKCGVRQQLSDWGQLGLTLLTTLTSVAMSVALYMASEHDAISALCGVFLLLVLAKLLYWDVKTYKDVGELKGRSKKQCEDCANDWKPQQEPRKTRWHDHVIYESPESEQSRDV